MEAGWTMKRIARACGLVAGLAALSGAAHAFQNEQGAPAQQAAEQGAGLPQQLDLAVPQPGKDTEVVVPGLGTIGKLPKLDFGLELLYGATENQQQLDTPPANDDVTVRGTLKHRF